MRAAITLLILAAICVMIAWYVAALPGTVTATIAGTTIQTSTPVAVALIAALILVVYLIIRALVLLVTLPRRNRSWRDRRARARGEVAVNRALIALAANDPASARREADRSRRLLGDTPLTLLLAAQAGRQAGREEEATALYELLAERSDGKLLGLRGLLRMAVQHQEWERATAIAAQAEKAHPGAAWLKEERRGMAIQTGQWREALRLAGPREKAALALAAAEHEDDRSAALGLAKQAFEADPALPAAALTYARLLREAGKERAAKDVLRRAWAARAHPDIVEAYAQNAKDKLDRSRMVTELVRTAPENVDGLLAMARAAIEAGLTREALRHLARAREMGVNQRRLWTLMAEVESLEGNGEAAQGALRHLPQADPDPAWRCTNCGTQHERWHPVCDACQATGTINWLPPTEPTLQRVPVLQAQAAGAEGLTV